MGILMPSEPVLVQVGTLNAFPVDSPRGLCFPQFQDLSPRNQRSSVAAPCVRYTSSVTTRNVLRILLQFLHTMIKLSNCLVSIDFVMLFLIVYPFCPKRHKERLFFSHICWFVIFFRFLFKMRMTNPHTIFRLCLKCTVKLCKL